MLSYEDANANSIREPEEIKLAGITFSVNDATQMISRYTTDGISEPYCFPDLAPGTYTVTWTGDNYEPTTPQNWTVEIMAGSILQREFGASPLGAGAEGQGGAASDRQGMPTWAIALIAAVGVIVILGGAGLVVYFLVLRRQEI